MPDVLRGLKQSRRAHKVRNGKIPRRCGPMRRAIRSTVVNQESNARCTSVPANSTIPK
ncbi:hypothetical protein [Lysobacter gummosus]|uniref:hypothetical protein n=1 Tax=Lysobacter gummosus TaxID=262324 RepID=UPI00362A6F9D